MLLASSGTGDIVDAHVVVCARRAGQAVITSDPDDLRRLDAGTGRTPDWSGTRHLTAHRRP
jgi:hypothetical protein